MRVALALVILLTACGHDAPDCRTDTQCAVGRRCAMGRCIPLEAPGFDASADEPENEGGPTTDAGVDASADAGPSSTFACELSVEAGPVSVGTVYSSGDAPQLVRAGASWALIYRAAPDDSPGVTTMFALLDQQGTVLESGAVEGSAPQPELALAATDDGSAVLAAWAESDEAIHAARLFGSGEQEPIGPAPVTERSNGSDFPALASNSDGFVLAFSDRVLGPLRVLTLSLDADGQPVGEVSPLELTGSATRPALAGTRDSSTPIAWRDSREPPSRLWMGLRGPDGAVTDHLQVSELPLGQSASMVETEWGTFLSWTVSGEAGAVHLSRVLGALSESSVIAASPDIDPRTSLAYDGRGLFVAWHEGTGDSATARVVAARADLSLASAASLELPAPASLPRVAASSRGSGAVIWVDPVTAEIEFAAVGCPQ